MYPNREVYDQPPVVLVTAQALFIDSPRLRQPENLAAFVTTLQDRYPHSDQVTSMGMEEAGPGLAPQMVPQLGVVLRNVEATESITLTSWSVTYETTAYREFETFQTGLVEACDTLISLNIRPALRRVGLRYINEVRVPYAVDDARDWAAWIDPAVLGTLSVASEDTPVRAVQGAGAFDLGNGSGLNVGYAALPQGTVVNPQFLARPPIPDGPAFVIDVDGYFEVGEDVTMQLNHGVVGEILSTVHTPAGAAFQRMITDNARAVFRGTGLADV